MTKLVYVSWNQILFSSGLKLKKQPIFNYFCFYIQLSMTEMWCINFCWSWPWEAGVLGVLQHPRKFCRGCAAPPAKKLYDNIMYIIMFIYEIVTQPAVFFFFALWKYEKKNQSSLAHITVFSNLDFWFCLKLFLYNSILLAFCNIINLYSSIKYVNTCMMTALTIMLT